VRSIVEESSETVGLVGGGVITGTEFEVEFVFSDGDSRVSDGAVDGCREKRIAEIIKKRVFKLIIVIGTFLTTILSVT